MSSTREPKFPDLIFLNLKPSKVVLIDKKWILRMGNDKIYVRKVGKKTLRLRERVEVQES